MGQIVPKNETATNPNGSAGVQTEDKESEKPKCSEREAERQYAEETGEKEATVRDRNRRAKKEMDGKTKNQSITESATNPVGLAGEEERPICKECGKNDPKKLPKLEPKKEENIIKTKT